MTTFAVIGFGELGGALAGALGSSGDHVVRAFAPKRSDRDAAAALEDRIERARANRSESLHAALEGAAVVLSAVPSSASLGVAEEVAEHIERGSFFVDLTAAPVEEIRAAAELIERNGARYVDAAVLGAVAASGHEVPIVASGPGAHDWCALVREAGLVAEALDAPVGHATLLKLLRSVYMKGREALIVEMLVAAHRYGLEVRVAESIVGAGEEVPFASLADRVLRSLALHARRRGDELHASGGVLAAAGVDPVMTRAGVDVLAALAELGLGDSFGNRRPESGWAVLERIERLSGRGSGDEP